MKFIITFLFSCFAFLSGTSQCLEITSIFVNSCGTVEGQNEMFTFKTGTSDIYVHDITVNWPSNSFLNWCTSATTASTTAYFNSTVVSGCGLLIEPLNDTIPAGSKVIVITSTSVSLTNNSFSNLADTMYVLYQCSGNTAGHFGNSPSGSRTLVVSVTGTCSGSTSASYTGAIPNVNGATAVFDASGNVSYVNNGCNAPVVTRNTDWDFPARICKDYGTILLDTTLSSLATSGGTWSGPRVTGNTYNSGSYLGLDSITYQLSSSNSCSSLDSTIVFTVYKPKVDSFSFQSCTPIWVNGISYSSDTVFSDTVASSNPFQCDSMIFVQIIIGSYVLDSSYFASCDSVLVDGNSYKNDTLIRDTVSGAGTTNTIDTILHTGFENSESWNNHSSGNWTETDVNGIWSGSGMYANMGSTNNGTRKIGMNDVGDYIELPLVNNPTSLSYYDRINSSSTNLNVFAIQYNNGTSWVTLQLDTCTHTNYQLVNVDLTSFTGQTGVQLRIYRTQDNRSGYIDDLTVYGTTHATTQSCDTIQVIEVKILRPTTFTQVSSSCDSVVSVTGKIFKTSGTYQDTIVNSARCDSIITYNVTINSVTSSTQVSSSCDSVVSVTGKIFKTSGTYQDTIVNSTGCDSIITYSVTINSVTSSTQVLNSCDSVVSATGKVFKSNGTYLDTIINTSGCDSVITYNITINSATTSSQLVTSTDSIISVTGKIFKVSGTYLDTIPNSNGCDSILTYNVVISSTTTSTQVVASCDSIISANGKVFKSSGIYSDTIINGHGYDSIITYNVTINTATSSTQNSVSCDSVVSVTGKIYRTSGVYQDTITNGKGCDSVITYAVTINTRTYSNQNLASCNQVVSASGKIFAASGNYLDTIVNSAGCDSIILYSVTIRKPTSSIQNETSCDSVVSASGKVYKTNGRYLDTIVNSAGCDSILIYNVLINSKRTLDIGSDTIICGDTPFFLSAPGYSDYVWNTGDTTSSIRVSTSGLYTLSVYGSNCPIQDSVLVQFVDLPSASFGKDTALFCGQNIVLVANNSMPGFYTLVWQDGSTQDSYPVNSPGVYSVLYSAPNGLCSVEYSINVTYNCDLFIPNSFSPNGDGLNDEFVPYSHNELDRFELQIFNRWGELLFTSTNSAEGWDGTFLNEKAQQGVYIWKLKYDFSNDAAIKTELKFGHVNLVR